MTDIEIEAEVFRVMRAHSEKGAAFVYARIKEHLPEIAPEKIKKALMSLYRRM